MILIVDDQPDISRALQLLLQHAGYRSTCVESGEAAIDILGRIRPGLIILDASMPDCSGLEILQVLRQKEGLEQVPVLFYSAFADPGLITQAKEAGAAGWLVKGRNSWNQVLESVARLYQVPQVSAGSMEA